VPHRKTLIPLAAAALLIGGVPVAAASPEAVLADYRADGVVDGAYSVDDLGRALALARAQGSEQYADAASAIQEARSAALTGRRSGGGDPPAPAAPAKEGPEAGGTPVATPAPVRSLEREPTQPLVIPAPPVVQPGAGVPWPFVVLSVLAGVLGLSGAASAAYRRLSR
jgi:hypothetical protein